MALDPSSAPQDNGQTAFNYFVGQGLTPVQASGIVGNLQGESGQGLNPNAVNKGDGRDGSDSIGIGQWNGDRAAALKAYADSKGVPWTDLNTQLEFLNQELQGPEAKAYAGLKAATTPEEAGQAFLAYERPKDWNKPGAHPERGQYAARAFAAYGGNPAPSQPQPTQTAQASPAAAPAGPLTLPPQAAPIFAQQQAPTPNFDQQNMMAMQPAMASPPIFAPPRRPVDLSNLQAALAAARSRPIFGA